MIFDEQTETLVREAGSRIRAEMNSLEPVVAPVKLAVTHALVQSILSLHEYYQVERGMDELAETFAKLNGRLSPLDYELPKLKYAKMDKSRPWDNPIVQAEIVRLSKQYVLSMREVDLALFTDPSQTLLFVESVLNLYKSFSPQKLKWPVWD